MAIDFTAQTLQVYKVDTSSGKRELKALTDAERSYVEKALAGAAQAEKGRRKHTAATGETTTATRKLYEQMSLLTSSIGGQNSALGKLAFGAKALTGGFGMLGIGMLGIGTAMRALDPLVGKLASGLGDLLGIGKDEGWTGLKDVIGLLAKQMDAAAAASARWRAELDLLDPVKRASVVAEIGWEQVEDLEMQLAGARQLLESMQSGSGSKVSPWKLGTQLTEVRRLNDEVGAAQAKWAAQADEAAEALIGKWDKDRKAGEAASKAADRAAEAALSQRRAYWLLEEQILATAAALAELYRANRAVAGIGGEPGMVGGGPGKTPLQALGAGAGLDIKIGAAGKTGGPLGGSRETLELQEMLESTKIDRTAKALKSLEQSRVFSTVRDSAVEMWEAIATGAMSAADATKQAVGNILLSGGKLLAGEAIKEGVLIFTDWAKAAAHAIAAAKAAAGATAMFAMAGAMGAGGGGSGTGGFSAGGGSAPVDRTEVHNYFIGESFTGQSPRQLYSHQQQISSVGSRRTS